MVSLFQFERGPQQWDLTKLSVEKASLESSHLTPALLHSWEPEAQDKWEAEPLYTDVPYSTWTVIEVRSLWDGPWQALEAQATKPLGSWDQTPGSILLPGISSHSVSSLERPKQAASCKTFP